MSDDNTVLEPGAGLPDSVRPGSDIFGGRLWPAVLLLVAGLSTLALFLWEPFPPGIWHDDGVYLLLGQALADGEGLRYVGVSGAPPAPKFPPLYPMVLALVWRLFPDLPGETGIFGLLNVAVLIAAGAIFTAYLRRALRLPVAVALAIAAIAWLSLDLWRVAMVPLSEPLFILLLVAALWSGTALELDPQWKRIAVFLGAFALVFHTRTMGVVVGAAVPLALITRGYRREAAATVLGATALALPWMIWSGAAVREVPEPLRDILGSYGGWLGAQAAASPGAFLLALPASTWGLLDRLLRALVPAATPSVRMAAALVLVPAFAFGLREVARRSRSAGFTVVLLIGLLWVLPFLDRRLVTPLVPFVWAACALGFAPGLRELWQLRPGGSGPPRPRRGPSFLLPMVGVLAVAWGSWFLVGSTLELRRGLHVAPYRIRARMLARSVEALRGIPSEGAVVGAPELWPGIHLHTGLTVAPSAPFRPVSSGGPLWGDPGQQFQLWQAADVDYTILEQGGLVHGAALTELGRLCPDGAVQYVAIWAGGSLAKLDWDDECRRRALEWEASER